MNDLHKQLQENNDRYWRVRNRIKKQQIKNKITYTEKRDCRYQTMKMIKAGEITHKPCEICGLKESQVHHFDYSNAEDVIFLCQKHHLEWHKNNN